MLKYFDCEAGRIPIEECLNKCPRPEGRCLSLPTLKTIGAARQWKGTPSVTQLINPTRMEYLKLTEDWAVTPKDMAFALLGIRHHSKLEDAAKLLGLDAEVKLTGEVSGILDLLEPDELNGGFKLIDYKTWGSYAVAKNIGLKDSGNDIEDVQWQLNYYRMLAEEAGIKVSRLFVQVCVRDGGTYVAKKNGIEEKLMLLQIDKLEDSKVKRFFSAKRFALMNALENKSLPELCEVNERWGGRRCKGYCPVAEHCPEGRLVNKIF